MTGLRWRGERNRDVGIGRRDDPTHILHLYPYLFLRSQKLERGGGKEA